MVPLVGLVEGLAVAATYLLTVNVLPPYAASSLALLAHLVITGGIHVEGLADYVDALASGKRGVEALKVMRDPRVGAVGVSSIFAILAPRIFAISELSQVQLVLSYIGAAEAMYVAARLTKRTPTDGIGKLFVGEAKKSSPLPNIASLLASYLVVLLVGLTLTSIQTTWFAKSVIVAVIVALLVTKHAEARIGFINGNVLGAVYEITLTMLLIVYAVRW
jgi:adenosylcobinamide-GDP ribazoletransferase